MVKITETNGTVEVASPYHPAFPPAARMLSGKFNRGSSVWVFPASQLGRVRELCQDIYGTDGTAQELVTVRVVVEPISRKSDCQLYIAGRKVASVSGRDSGARLGDGIVLLEGAFSSGGSMKNPGLFAREGTTIEILDLPKAKADELVAGEEAYVASAEIVGETTLDVDALKEERERLQARIGEIDALLADHSAPKG